jgi:hypothetical protein
VPGRRSVKGRVAVVITVPICLLLAVAGLAVDGRAEALGDARTTRTEVGLSLRVQALVHQLQRERGLTNGLLGGEKEFRGATSAWSATRWPSSPTAPANCSPRSWYVNSTPRPWRRDGRQGAAPAESPVTPCDSVGGPSCAGGAGQRLV